MQDRKFRSRKELEKELNNFFASKDRNFFRNSIYKFFSRWEKVFFFRLQWKLFQHINLFKNIFAC